jgi:UDP-4-amino-4,6-dideoxy-N-acetyl-beta-L-altrosamine transaminase
MVLDMSKKRKTIPYSRQWISTSDVSAVSKTLRSDWLTQGPKIKEFEDCVAEYCGARYAVAVSSGTAALHIAALAAGFSPEDEVITTPITFVATANSIVYTGAKPVLADIHKKTYNINPLDVENRITPATKGIIPVDFTGQPADVVSLERIARKHNLIIIEDAAQALGASYYYRAGHWFKTGSCRHTDMAILSFHPVKHITTGEGGMVLTNNEEFYNKLLMLRNHGITRNPEEFSRQEKGMWYFEMQTIGFNYRITDFQCALGLNQMKRIDEFANHRREIAQLYNYDFESVEEIIIPFEKDNVYPSYHLYVIQLVSQKLIKQKARFFKELRKRGLGVNVHHVPVHFHPFYQKRYGYKEGDFPEAEQFYQRAVSLPIFPKMTDADIRFVVRTLKKTIYEFQKH